MKGLIASVTAIIISLASAASILPSPDVVEEAEEARAAYLERMRALNAPGTVAPDFPVILPDGTRSTFSALVAADGETIVVFYDPDCDTCHQYLQTLRDDAALQQAVVVIDTTGDVRLMARDAGFNPAAWRFASVAIDIEEQPLYYIESFPTIFVIDASRTIQTKVNI